MVSSHGGGDGEGDEDKTEHRAWWKSERLNVKKYNILSVSSGKENPLTCEKRKVK